MPVIISDGKKVIDTGIALPFSGRSVTVSVQGLGNIEFIFDRPGGAQEITIDPVPGGAIVKLKNLSTAPFGGGLKSTFEIGTVNGKKAYMNLRWYDLNDIGPHLIYCFYHDM